VTGAGGTAELAPFGDYRAKPDVAIVVFGETPSAEGLGDIPSLQLRAELKAPLAVMQRLRARGIPVVAVMLSGRPLSVNAEMNAANGFVEAWLPGSEGEGVADMLFAKAGTDFQGRLPMAWPVSAKPGAPALFGFGYGLTLAQGPRPWTALDEDTGMPPFGTPGLFTAQGTAIAGWSFRTAAPSGRLRIRDAKDETMPGARHLSLKAGKAPATLELVADQPSDMRRDAANAMAVMTVRFDAAPTGAWTATVACGDSCGKPVALPAIANVPVGKWLKLGVPLRCFAMSPQEVTHVTTPFSLAIDGTAEFTLAQVQLGTVADMTMPCAS